METRMTVGQTLKVDGWSWHVRLLDPEGYEGSEYRVELPGTGVSVPVRVAVMGRKVRWDVPMVGGGVRVRVEILDDDEAPSVVRGYMSWSELSAGCARINLS